MLEFTPSPEMGSHIQEVIKKIGIDPQKISVSIIDTTTRPFYAGHNDELLVYPASLYKLYVAAVVLEDVGHGRLKLEERVKALPINVVDEKKEIRSDSRPLLQPYLRYQVGYLLDLMITRSDNTAANVLIDLVTRERINWFMERHGWQESRVTRKFLPRAYDDLEYRAAPPTKTTTRHLVEFLFLLKIGRLLSSEGAETLLLDLLSEQLDKSKLAKGLPDFSYFAHKTGWYKHESGWGVCGDAGIVYFRGIDECVVACVVQVPGRKGENILKKFGAELKGIIADVG